MDRKIYNQIISEHFDIGIRHNRQVLLALNEADQNKVMMALSAKLYDMIVKRVDEIDYGAIPQSKGDITKIPNFIELQDCLQIIHDLLIEYKQPTTSVDTVMEAIENLKDSKSTWQKAFETECELPIVTYNTIALSIVSSVSFLISTSIEFIKDPVQNNYNIALDKVGYTKSKNNLLFKNLEKFNKAYKKGQIQKSTDQLIKMNIETRAKANTNEAAVLEEAMSALILGGTVIGLTATVVGLITCLIPLLQELVAMLYAAKQNVSDYFAVQSDLLRLNAENVKLDCTKTESEREKIYKKQIKIADSFKKLSNKLAIKLKSSEKQAEKIVKSDNSKKYDIEDIVDTAPSSASGIF
jgi:hypothetical protein